MEEYSGPKVSNTSSKIALLTASYGGLGYAFAKELQQRGYHLILTGRKEHKLQEMKQFLMEQSQLPVDTFICDTTIPEDIEILKQQLTTNNIKLDMLVNVAGIENEGWFCEQTTTDVLAIANTNVMGTLHMIHALYPLKNKTLHIINISSMAGFYNMPMKAVYSASKRFLIELTKTLNIELNEQNIYLTCIAPAGLKTRQEIIDKIESQGFMGKLTTVELDKVIHKSINKTLKRKQVYIPGLVNQILYHVSRLIPSRLSSNLIKRRWKKTTNNLYK